MILAALGRVPLWVWVVGLLAIWGYTGHRTAQQARVSFLENQSRLQAEARAAERAAAAKSKEVSDALHKSQVALAASSRNADERLRALAAAWAASAASAASSGACGRHDAPAVAVISDEARRDLVKLAEDADAVANRLKACQALVAK